jgi:ABC-type glycerol-3-phosphate transport system permease component
MATRPVRPRRFPLLRHDWPFEFGLILFGVITFYPLLFIISTSLKSNTQFYQSFWGPTFPFHFSNYNVAFDRIFRSILNSVVYSSLTIIVVAALASASGFVFARFKFPGKQALFYLFISLMMVPGVLTLAPRFVLVRSLHLLNQPMVLIVPWASSGIVLATWLMRSYFESLPQELFDAAHVDGASDVSVFRLIALPLARPMLATIAITSLINTWNDLIWPLVTISNREWMPLAQALIQFSSSFETDWGPLFAGYVLASIPLLIVFTFALRQFVSGLTAGALKA